MIAAKLKHMEVHLSPEKEAQLHQLATRTGKDTAQLVQEAVDLLLDYEAWFLEEVEKGLAQADRGELIEHEEAIRRIEKRLQDRLKQTRS